MKRVLIFLTISLFAPKIQAQMLTLSGTMHHTQLEGGCWYLQTDDGKHYELTGDASIVNPLRVDSQRIEIQAEIAKGAASICMVGQIVRVIKRIDNVRYAQDPLIMQIALDGKMYHAKNGYWYLKTSSGKQYEFKTAPANVYRHSGVRFHQKVRVLLDKAYTHNKKMEGEILPESTQQPKEKNIPKKYDPR